MDVEGHEATLVRNLNPARFKPVDILLEVGSEANASIIYSKVNELGWNMFSQKNNWGKVSNERDVPTSYKEGSLFITQSHEMNWFRNG
jgi:hypothetical protein